MAVARYSLPGRSFFGRRAELDAVREILTHEPILTVTGIGGIGKTRIATELLRIWDRDAVFVDLVEVQSRVGLIDALARALLVRPEGVERSDEEEGGDTLEQALRAAWGARGRALLVLDNFEQLVSEAPSVDALAEAAPEARVLVTSREPMRLSREAVLELMPLDAAEELFVDRLRSRQPGYEPGDEDRAKIGALVSSLDRIPLAIELAAERAAVLGLDAMLQTGFAAHLSAPGPRDRPARHRTMRAVIDDTLAALDGSERHMLDACVMLRGAFEASDVVGIADDPASRAPRPAPFDPLGALQRLRELSLVTSDDAHRLRVLTVIREVVLASMDPNVERTLATRHALHFARLAESGASPRWISLGWDNLDAALDRLLTGATDVPDGRATAWRLLLSVGESALRSGRLASLQERCDLALSTRELTGPLRAEMLVLRSRVARRRGRIDSSDADFAEALKIATSDSDTRLRARVLRQQSLRLARAARLDEAVAAFESARELHDPTRNGGDGNAYDVLGLSSALRQGGDIARATLVLEAFLAGRPRPCDQGLALIELTLAQLESGAHEEALRSATSALDVFVTVGWSAEEARARMFVGLAHLCRNDRALAEASLRRAIALAQDASGSSAGQYARGYLGLIHLEASELEAAEAELARVVPPDGGHIALFASYRAAIAALSGELDKARALYDLATREDVPPTLEPAIKVQRAYLAVVEARMHREAGESMRAEAALGRATALVSDVDRTGAHADVHLASRIAKRLLDLAPGRTARTLTALDVHAVGDWFAIDGGAPVSCGRQASAKRALVHLARFRLMAPGEPMTVAMLASAIWPDDKVRESAARNRIRVAVALLRKVGLRELIITDKAGYRISEWAAVRVVADALDDPGPPSFDPESRDGL